jgi:hypothetical protein
VTTNQLIVVTNDLLGDGLSTYRSVTANVVTANNLFFGSLNVAPTLTSAFSKANTANVTADLAYGKANTANVTADLAYGKANTANLTADLAYGKANAANVIASAAFDKANAANVTATSSVLKTGNTMTGNLVMSSANITFATAVNSGIYWGGTGLSFIHSPTANTLVFGTSFTEDMRLDSNGRLGISTASPRAKFDIIGASVGSVTTLTDAATITPDFSSNNYFTVTLGGNRVLANATNTVIGQSGVIYVIQDITGSRTLSFGSSYKFTDNTPPTLTTTANAVDAIVYAVRTANSYVCQVIYNVGNRNDT